MLFKKGNYYFNENLNFGDKSITHRAFICGALADGNTEIENACICRDTLATADCLQQMGARFEFKGTSVVVTPIKNIPTNKTPLALYCANSGTTARLLAGVAAGLGVRAVFTGDESLSKRPMDRVIQPLSQMGLGIKKKHGVMFETFAQSTSSNEHEYAFQTSSAQVKSSLLFAALTSGKRIKITEKIKSRNHTEIMLGWLGAQISIHENQIELKESKLKNGKIKVPNDISTAAFFVVHGLLGDGLTLHQVGLNPTRVEFVSLLKESGADIKTINETWVCGELRGDIVVKKSLLKPLKCTQERSALLLDEIPALAILALRIKGKSLFEGVAELSAKESDRLFALRSMVNALGAKSIYRGNDTLEIEGVGHIVGGNLDTCKDHRLQFAAAIAGLNSDNGVETDFDFADVSCPDFLKILGMEKYRFGLVGTNIDGSMSPKLFSLFAQHFSVPCSYDLFKTIPENFFDRLSWLKNNCDGFNITMPFKRMLTSDGASYNSVAVKCGRFLPASTDGDGVVMSLEKHGISISGKKLLIIGAGGSAVSAACSLKEHGAQLFFANRTVKKARELADYFDGQTHCDGNEYFGVLSFIPIYDKMLFVEKKDIAKTEFVFDAYYFNDTNLLQSARGLGKKAIDGLDMLFFQAIRAFEIFTSIKVSCDDIDILYKKFRSAA